LRSPKRRNGPRSGGSHSIADALDPTSATCIALDEPGAA
jgi:hypothetical protein